MGDSKGAVGDSKDANFEKAELLFEVLEEGLAYSSIDMIHNVMRTVYSRLGIIHLCLFF